MQARDPIPQFRDFVLKQSILSEAQIKDIDAEVEAIVDDAVKFADESPKPVRSPTLEIRASRNPFFLPHWQDLVCFIVFGGHDIAVGTASRARS